MESYNSLFHIQTDIQSGTINVQALVDHYLKQIQEKKDLNAFLEVFAEEARLRAAEIDQKIHSGKAGRLAGMVIGIKDNIAYKGHNLSASSHILENFVSLYDSTVLSRLLAEDAIIIGRLNCDEFAMGGSNETSYFGAVKNADNISKVPGGSSGGSAVAVQAGLCLAALGTDTGGSIRQPASFCGVLGLKPSYGRVSRYGIIAYASSFDQAGPLCKSVSDAALILEVIAGHDERDATASKSPVPLYTSFLGGKKKDYKIAYIPEYLNSQGIDPEIKEKTWQGIQRLKSEGHQLEEVSFPYLEYLVPTYYILATAEASSNLARYDGVHFGYRSQEAKDLETTYKKSRSEGFGKEVKRRIMLGTFVLSAGYYDAYYAKAQKVRRLIQQSTNEILGKFDFILSPTTPSTAFNIGEKTTDPLTMYLADIFNVQASLAGIPAISLPLFKHSNGMSFGLQLMAARFDEAKLLNFSQQLMEKNS